MARLVLTVAGAVIGAMVGAPTVGAQLGAAIGGAIGGAIGASLETLPTVYGPRMDDRSVQVSSYGVPIPLVFGTPVIAGNVIWATEIEEVVSEEEIGGKGGPSQTQVTYSYYGTFAVLLGRGPAQSVRRIWADSVLLYDSTASTADLVYNEEVYGPGYAAGSGAPEFVFYQGTETQMPDPTIESAVGVGLTPAYRGCIYIVFNRLPLEKFGNRLPSIRAELVVDPEQTVAGCVDALAAESGMVADEIDTSAIDMPLRGYIVGQVAPARAAIEQLAAAFLFTGSEVDGRLVFRRRGGDPVSAVAREHCGAALEDGEQPAIESTRVQELDLPAQMSVTAPDPARDQEPGAQLSERLTARSGQVGTWQTAAVLSDTEAKRLADALLYDAWAQRTSFRWTTDRRHAALAPGDVIVLDGRRVRVTSRSDEGALLRFEAVGDDEAVVAQASSGVAGEFYAPDASQIVPTAAWIVDTSLLRDADDAPGAYVAASGVAEGWRGGVLLASATGTSWSAAARLPAPGAGMGRTRTALGAWIGGDVFDETNSVVVAMGNGAPSSATRAAVLAGANAAAIESGNGWEIVQYRTAALNGDGSYTLSGLLRGRLGTEWATAGHAAGDRVVLLSATTLRDLPLESADVGVERYYRAVSVGQSVMDAAIETATVAAERLKPRSPVDLRIARAAGGDATLTWKRRTRLSTRFVGAGGIRVPLGEAAEAYDVEIWDAGHTSLKRTVATSAPTLVYTAAQQSADFGAPQASIHVRIHQISAAVGRGHPLEASA